MSKREEIGPQDGDKRYIKRNAKGRITDKTKGRSATTGRYIAVSHDSHRPIRVGSYRAEVDSYSSVIRENKPKLSLGERLMALRQKIVESGQTLLSWDEINEEAARRRGKVE